MKRMHVRPRKLAQIDVHLLESWVRFRAHEHPSNDVRAAHALRALDLGSTASLQACKEASMTLALANEKARQVTHHAEPPLLFCMGIGVRAIRQIAGVVAVHDVIDLVLREELVEELRCEIVRNPCTATNASLGPDMAMTHS